AALAAITQDLCEQGGIQKGRKNQQQGYAFRGIDQLLDGLAPLLAKHKVVISPIYGERTCEARTTQKGGTFYSVTLTGEFTFRCAVDGSAIVVRTIGEAMDSADKATNKAMSAAFKYALTQTLCIPFEVEDADATTPEPTVPAEVTPPARGKAAATRQATAEDVEAAKRRSITGLQELLGYSWADIADIAYETIGKRPTSLQAARAELTEDERGKLIARLQAILAETGRAS